jgi:outer membrane protein assembly factor BamD
MEGLYSASLREFRNGRFERACLGFQRLALELPGRDTLSVRARFLLGECRAGQRDFVTAAREFRRVADEYPAHPLAPEALLRAGDAHAELWRRPELDPTNAQTALALYQELQSRYAAAPAAQVASVRIRALNEDFATKEYQNALFYYRRGAYESAILYLRNLIATYPSATIVPEAFVRLVRAYHAIGYREEEQETCEHIRRIYPAREDVREACGDGRVRG